jgi:propanediol utilization protein
MHCQAKFGVAAHWRYKEGDVPYYSSFVLEMVESARCVLPWQNGLMDRKLHLSRGEVEHVFPSHYEACPCRDLSYDLPYKEDHRLFLIVVVKDKVFALSLLLQL